MANDRSSVVRAVLCAAFIGVAALARAQDELAAEARRLDLEGKHDAAISLYRQALERAPDSFDAHYGIARALDLAGRYDEARRHFARAIDLAPDGAKDQALRMMGIAHAFVGDAAGAAPYFQEVFDRRVKAGNLFGAAQVANELGRVYLERGDPGAAFRWYRTGYETAARQPDRPAAQVDGAEFQWAHAQARIAARRGDEAEARRQEAVAKSLLDKGNIPDQQIHYPYLQGYVEFLLGNYDAAIAALQQANQEDPFILVLLAQAFEASGMTDSAREHYGRVLASSSHAVTNAFARPLARQKLGLAREPG